MEETKLWATLYRRQKIVMETLFPCTKDLVLSAGLQTACKEFDIAVPLVLQKHERELAQFSRTCFSPRDFMEAFPYTSFCVELYSLESEKKQGYHAK